MARLLRSILLALAATFCAGVLAQTPAATGSAEARADRALMAAKKIGAPELYAFLKPMPKGADLHMHLSGAIYAETFLAEGARQGLCVDKAALAFAQPARPGKCSEGQVLAADAIQDQGLYDKLINSFSMRSFVPYAGFSGHDQFFTTFDRFSGLHDVQGEWLDEVATRAAAQNEQYLEIMNTPSFNRAAAAAKRIGWPAVFNDVNHMEVLAKLREQLLASELREDVAADEKEIADAKAARADMEHCGPEPAPQGSPCGVRIHTMYQVLRGFSPSQVFAQTLLGFELASADPDVVGINFVRAEDRRDAMGEYHTEMLMLDYLHSAYPKVHISLHAGELAPGIVPPDGMSFHIREAIDLGHAERIGHGVDVLHEDRPNELLREMAQKHIMVEVNLTSNAVILGIQGPDHPLAAYRAAHVPAALSTDDEGVSRIDLTHEYVRAVVEQNLHYADLKNMARTSLEHSFLPGESLWASMDDFTRRKSVCAAAISASSRPGALCADWLRGSEKAAQQWELEQRLASFEAGVR